MARAARSWSEIWLGVGSGLVIGAVMMGAYSALELATWDATAVSSNERFGAVLRTDGKGYLLETDGGSHIACAREFCGYRTSSTDLDVRRNYAMRNGRLIAVERDGQWTDLRPEILASKRDKLMAAGALIAASVPCFWAGLRARREERRALTGVHA